jgi:hypothetical protein
MNGPLLAGLLATTALVLVIGCGNDTEPARGETGSGASATSGRGGGVPAPVEDYLRFADEGTNTDADPQAMAEGLRKLAGALGALSLGPPALQVDLRVAAEHILLNPSAQATTATVRDGLLAAAEAIESTADGEDSLRRLAESVRPSAQLLDQRTTVNEFLVQSATALDRISRRPDPVRDQSTTL